MMQDPDPIKALIKKVGRGKTLSRGLGCEEAREALERLLRGEFTPAQAGAFLQAMRIKETSVEELLGAVRGAESFRQGQFPSPAPAGGAPLVVNLSFDTARKGGILSLPALAFLRAAGLVQPVVVWEPPRLFDKIDAMGRTLASLQAHPLLARSVPELVKVREICPPWSNLAGLRRELGFRTILNTLEKLLRPWPEVPVVVGISHDTFSERLCRVFSELGVARGAVIQGHHGTCDLGFGEQPTSGHVWRGGRIERVDYDTEIFPWASHGAALLLSGLDSWSGWIADETSPFWGMIRAQAALFLSVATGKSLTESIEIIRALPKGD